ncbi:MAG: S8 family serine peptidase [Verrucomicrobiae bacterium]|nr:S8 family serine peptidase [Verrucomicrobiae bacterium]
MNTSHRRTHSPLAWLAVALLVFSGSLPAQVIPGRYIAVLKAETRDIPGAAKAMAAQHNLNVDHVYTKALKGFAFAGSEQAAQALARRAEIAYVEPDQVCTGAGQTQSTGFRRCDADAIPGLLGSGLMVDADVAVIDTGLDAAHPDLNVMPGGVRFYLKRDRLLSDSNWQDDHWHGTHVGGVIGALDNDFGVVGVAPGARLWAVKVLDASNQGTAATVIAGVDWVVQRAAIFEVANMSLSLGRSQAVNDAVKAGTQAGIVFVVAAGNGGQDAANVSPASEPTALTVSALEDEDGLPGSRVFPEWYLDDWLSSWPESNFGEVVDVCAPGVQIYSTGLTSKYPYRWNNGTSAAAAHVSGAAALYIAQYGLIKSAAGVEAICAAIRNSGWPQGHYASFTDADYYGNPDGFREPLLNVANLLYRSAPATLNILTPPDVTKVQGLVTVQVTTTAPEATAVQLYFDGQIIGEDSNGADGWNIPWDTTTIADGVGTLVAVATDGTTQLAGEAIVVGVNNTNGFGPWVTILEPWQYPVAYLFGDSEVVALASDMAGPVAVDFYLGEVFLGRGLPKDRWGEYPAVISGVVQNGWLCSLTWDTTAFPDGTNVITAVATAADGSTGSDPYPVVVAVQNNAIRVSEIAVTGLTKAGGQWTTTFRVTVETVTRQRVPGATVYAQWSTGPSSTQPVVSAVTDANGQCFFTETFKKNYFAASLDIVDVVPPPELPEAHYNPALSVTGPSIRP